MSWMGTARAAESSRRAAGTSRAGGFGALALAAIAVSTLFAGSAVAQEAAPPAEAWFLSGGYGHTIHWGATHTQLDIFNLTPEWNRRLGDHFDYALGVHLARSRAPDGWFGALTPIGVLVWPSRKLPYWRMGAGFGWTDLTSLEEVGRRFNFFLQMGLGTRWYSRGSGPWTAEIRFLHMSNANTASRNGGINSLHLLFGRGF